MIPSQAVLSSHITPPSFPPPQDLYGIRVQKFLEGVCIDMVGGLESVPVGAVSLDVICQVHR